MKKELLIKLLGCFCLSFAFAIVISVLVWPILPPFYKQVRSPLLEDNSYVGWVSGGLFFFILLLTIFPLAKKNQKLFLILKSFLLSSLVSYLVFVIVLQLQYQDALEFLILTGISLFLGLVLLDWKK